LCHSCLDGGATVSVHVSHLLHKTGTANRIELAQLARRVQT
jgi:DNA-binding NarL/FixJ family response regulator